MRLRNAGMEVNYLHQVRSYLILRTELLNLHFQVADISLIQKITVKTEEERPRKEKKRGQLCVNLANLT